MIPCHELPAEDESGAFITQGRWEKVLCQLETARADERAACDDAERLKHALAVILPMARAWAHEHNVGGNQDKCEWAARILDGPLVESPEARSKTPPSSGNDGESASPHQAGRQSQGERGLGAAGGSPA